MMSTLSEKLYGSDNEAWLELSGLILKKLQHYTFCSVLFYISVLELIRII
jgi:hypothetical protein